MYMKLTFGELKRLVESSVRESESDEVFVRAWGERINYGRIAPLVAALSSPAGKRYTLRELERAGITFPVRVWRAPIDDDPTDKWRAWTSSRWIAESFMEEIGGSLSDIQTRVVGSPDEVIAFHSYENEFILER